MLPTLGNGPVAQTGSGQERPSTEALVNMIASALGVTSTERAHCAGRTAVASRRRH
ncbi:MAG: hypothetical protein ACRDJE_00865 [Dehalococcoidia bacterium]